MRYSTQQDVLDFVEDNNVKFVRFAFCDIFGTQKNIAVLASDLPKALEDGVCFDGSSIAGCMKVEESDLVLRPDLPTVTILPWRPTEGRVMQFFCDVEKPDGDPFGGNCRGFLREMNRRFRQLGLTCNVGAECEFYLFENDDRGRPTRIPIDFGGYFDVAPLDAGENLRRDICLTMEDLVDYAKSFLGTRYVWGGASPSGFDCSGFTMYVYAHFGYRMSHGASDQLYAFTRVSTAERLAGDLVFFSYGGGDISHVGIYLGGGAFIHATSNGGVKISYFDGYYSSTYVGAVRILAD